jgi:hypothetical protein
MEMMRYLPVAPVTIAEGILLFLWCLLLDYGVED